MEAVDYGNSEANIQIINSLTLSRHLNFKDACNYELDFLGRIDRDGHLYYNEEFLKVAIKRYEKYWLPLLASLSDSNSEDLMYAPPLDVHWVWHVHMLAPVSYRTDCLAVTGGNRVLNHQLNSLTSTDAKREKTRMSWNRRYPNVPFEISDVSGYRDDDTDFQSKITYDINAAAQRQGAFYYQVSLPHYKDNDFMGDAFLRYKMYLALKRDNKEKFLVPCYDIDLVWHTHQVHPALYYHDMMNILGFVLKHDDSVNDRSEGSKLNTSDAITRNLWSLKFGVPFARPGAMFRGNPPNGHLLQLTPTLQKSLLAPKEMDVELDSVRLDVSSRVRRQIQSALAMMTKPSNGDDSASNGSNTDLSLAVQLTSNGKHAITLYTCDVPHIQGLSNGDSEKADEEARDTVVMENPPEGLVHFAVNQGNTPQLLLRLERGKSKPPKKKSQFSTIVSNVFGIGNKRSSANLIAYSELPLELFSLVSDNFNSQETEARRLHRDIKIPTKMLIRQPEDKKSKKKKERAAAANSPLSPISVPEMMAEVRLNLTNIKVTTAKKDVTFSILRGSFYDCIMPEHLETLWGPIPLPRLPIGVDNKCRAVTHG